MKTLNVLVIIAVVVAAFTSCKKELPKTVSKEKMQEIYEEVKTPYKYGLVMVPEDDSKKMDCPTVYRKGDKWFMTYFVFDGRGYENLVG